MRRSFLKWLLTLACLLGAACAVITVNVYFPEKAAKEAFKSLDDMLLKNRTPGAEKGPGGGLFPPAEPVTPPEKPRSSLFELAPGLSLVSTAYAADVSADALAVEVSSMPEVLKAYDDMSARLPRLNALLSSGAVGLTNQGLITVRDKTKMSGADEGMVAAENQNRKTVITGMAKAILKLNKQKESKEALDLVMAKAAATYADTKREAAQPGWWMQLQNGRWVQK